MSVVRITVATLTDNGCVARRFSWDRGRGGVPGGCFSIRWGARLARNEREARMSR